MKYSADNIRKIQCLRLSEAGKYSPLTWKYFRDLQMRVAAVSECLQFDSLPKNFVGSFSLSLCGHQTPREKLDQKQLLCSSDVLVDIV